MYTVADGLSPVRAGAAAALAAAKVAKELIEKSYNTCKNIRCKIAVHDAHHYFKWPFNRKMCHIQLNCWIKGVKGSRFVLRFPYSCDFPGAPGGAPLLLPPDDQDDSESEE